MSSKLRNILFVNPYFGEWKSIQSVAATNAPPLGIGYVASWVKEHSDAKVTLIDPVPMGVTRERVLEMAADFDCVAISCYTDIRFSCLDFADDVKNRYQNCTVIVGGPHVYYLDRKILENHAGIDIIVRGEGEFTMEEIVNGQPLSMISGVTYREDGRIIRNSDRQLHDNIDDFAIDYDAVLPDSSLYQSDNEVPFSQRLSSTAYLIESRGCPFSCSYCANDHWQRTWRGTSPHKTVDKMEQLFRRDGVTHFRFYDDLFTANEKRVLEFCKILQDREMPITFRVLVRAGTSLRVLEALKQVGCISVGFGIESGSADMLKNINKKISVEQIRQTITQSKNLGFWTVGSFIVGFEGETEEDYLKTLSFCHELDVIQTNVQIIFPYTPFYLQLKQRGEVDDDIWFDRKYDGRILYTRENFSSAPWSHEELKWLALKTYYTHIIKNRSSSLRYLGIKKFLFQYCKALVDLPARGRVDHLWKVVRNSPH